MFSLDPVMHERARQCAHLGEEASLMEVLDRHLDSVLLDDIAWAAMLSGHGELVNRMLTRPDVRQRKSKTESMFNVCNTAIEQDALATVQVLVKGGYVDLALPMGKLYLKEAVNHQATQVLPWLLAQWGKRDVEECAAELIRHTAGTLNLPVAVTGGTEAKRLTIAHQVMDVCDPALNHSAALVTAARNQDDAMVRLLWDRSNPMDAAEACMAHEQWSDLDSLAAYMPLAVQAEWVQRCSAEHLPETSTRLRVLEREGQLKKMESAAPARTRYRS